MTVTKDDVVESAVAFVYAMLKQRMAEDLIKDNTDAKSEEAIKEYDDISYEACVKLMGVVATFEGQRLKA